MIIAYIGHIVLATYVFIVNVYPHLKAHIHIWGTNNWYGSEKKVKSKNFIHINWNWVEQKKPNKQQIN